MPSYNCINANAQALARYAALCVEGGLVPIVEPEVLMDGEHDIDTCEKITEWVLKEVYRQLYYAKVPLEKTVLKPNMVISGKKCAKQASRQEVAERTVKVPEELRAAGGAGHRLPVGRAVGRGCHRASVADEPAGTAAVEARPSPTGGPCRRRRSKAWGGKSENVAAGQRAFTHRAKMNGAAALGKWTEQQEKAA